MIQWSRKLSVHFDTNRRGTLIPGLCDGHICVLTGYNLVFGLGKSGSVCGRYCTDRSGRAVHAVGAIPTSAETFGRGKTETVSQNLGLFQSGAYYQPGEDVLEDYRQAGYQWVDLGPVGFEGWQAPRRIPDPIQYIDAVNFLSGIGFQGDPSFVEGMQVPLYQAGELFGDLYKWPSLIRLTDAQRAAAKPLQMKGLLLAEDMMNRPGYMVPRQNRGRGSTG